MYFNVFVLSIYTYYMNTLYISQSLFKCVCVYVNEYIIYIYITVFAIYIHILYDHITHTHGFGFHCHLVSLSLRDIYTSVAETLVKGSDYPTHLSTSILECWAS